MSEEEDLLDFKIKWRDEVADIYDVPRSVSNNELFLMVFSELFRPELKLLGKKNISLRQSRFTIDRWMKKMKYEESTVRGVLGMSNYGESEEDGGSAANEKTAELEAKMKALEIEKEGLEKKLENTSAELKLSNLELKKEKKKVRDLQSNLKGRDREISTMKENISVLEKKQKSSEKSPTKTKESRHTSPSQRGMIQKSCGIWVPDPTRFHFEENERTDERIKFTSGKKIAQGNGVGEGATFVGNVLFRCGGIYYFQVKAVCKEGSYMRIGVLHGTVDPDSYLEKQAKGWSFPMFNHEAKSVFEGTVAEYGPKRVFGVHSVGVLVDFSSCSSSPGGGGDRFGKVSFVVNGKDYGVAFRKVLPPVKPAFSLYHRKDSYEIEQSFVIPQEVQSQC